jgi:hypothetical protein
MPVEHHEVQLISPAGGHSHGAFSFDDEGDVCRLTFRHAGGRVHRRGVRRLRGVVPATGAARSGELAAYRLHPGRPAGLADLVALFACCPDVEPASVEEQRQSFDRWLQTLGGGS